MVHARDRADEILSPSGFWARSTGSSTGFWPSGRAAWAPGPDGWSWPRPITRSPNTAYRLTRYRSRGPSPRHPSPACPWEPSRRPDPVSGCVIDAGVEGAPLVGARLARPAHRKGDIVSADGLRPADVDALLEGGAGVAVELCVGGADLIRVGRDRGRQHHGRGGPGRRPPETLIRNSFVGLGAGSDSAIVAAKRQAVAAAVARAGPGDALRLLGVLGGGEFVALAGVVLGAARSGR